MFYIFRERWAFEASAISKPTNGDGAFWFSDTNGLSEAISKRLMSPINQDSPGARCIHQVDAVASTLEHKNISLAAPDAARRWCIVERGGHAGMRVFARRSFSTAAVE